MASCRFAPLVPRQTDCYSLRQQEWITRRGKKHPHGERFPVSIVVGDAAHCLTRSPQHAWGEISMPQNPSASLPRRGTTGIYPLPPRPLPGRFDGPDDSGSVGPFSHDVNARSQGVIKVLYPSLYPVASDESGRRGIPHLPADTLSARSCQSLIAANP